MRIHLSQIPQKIIDEYDVMKYVEADGYVYVEITVAMYGLSASGYIANQDLRKHLAKYDYYPTKRTPGLWKHQTRLISFTLVVDDFGIKYTNKDDINHLFKAIKDKALQQFQHPTPKNHHYGPTKYVPPEYEKKYNIVRRTHHQN